MGIYSLYLVLAIDEELEARKESENKPIAVYVDAPVPTDIENKDPVPDA